MEITNDMDIIDSRKIIERIREIEEFGAVDKEGSEELELLLDVKKQIGNWDDSFLIINESYFTEYIQDFCEDIGDIPRDLPWYIADCLDWDRVARNLSSDYHEVDFDGVTYFAQNR